jgi:hypothetical protein
MSLSTIVSLLISGGAGMGLTALLTPVIQHFSHRSETRAHAADLIAEAAGNFTDRVAKLNEQLDARNRQMRTSIMLLTDVVDQVIPFVDASPAVIQQLKKANNAAKTAIY